MYLAIFVIFVVMIFFSGTVSVPKNTDDGTSMDGKDPCDPDID